MKIFPKITFVTLMIFLTVSSQASARYSKNKLYEKIIHIKPFDGKKLANILFDMDHPTPCFFCRKFFIDLKATLEEKGYSLETISNDKMPRTKGGYLVSFDYSHLPLQLLKHYEKSKKILFLWEPEHVSPKSYDPLFHKNFSKVFTWSDDLVDNKKYYKFYWPQPCLTMRKDIPSFHTKKLCVLIAGNKLFEHPQTLSFERFKAINFFEAYAPQDFDLYGPKYVSLDRNLSVYKGEVPLSSIDKLDTKRLALAQQSKLDCIKNYRFYLCYENMAEKNGYITEKIFDCFAAGCVPVYWGAKNISDSIPESCFIDRRQFATNEELYAFLKAMDEKTYNMYLENIKNFLDSKQVCKFSTDAFIELFCKALNI